MDKWKEVTDKWQLYIVKDSFYFRQAKKELNFIDWFLKKLNRYKR